MATNKKQSESPTVPSADWLPMFYSKPMCIDPERHRDAGILPTISCAFAKSTNSIPLNITEFVEAAKNYPIVFTSETSPIPAIIVGLEAENYFVDKAGHWKQEYYVPDYVRKYPFIFLHVPENNQFALCVDEDSEQFCAKKTKESTAFYDADGKPSQLTQSALDMLTAYQSHHFASQEFCKIINELGLLTPNKSTITLSSGRVVSLGGFQMIDEAKFKMLSEEKIIELHRKNWLPFIYFALMSVSNWRRVGDMASLSEKMR